MAAIGIPRSLLYYDYAPFFRTFFKASGNKLVISKKTDQDILERGRKNTITEFCLPIKVFIGHVDYLTDKCDSIFISSMVTAGHTNYICPKIIGSPDIARATIKANYIELMLDDEKDYESPKEIMLKFGLQLKNNPITTFKAATKAQEALKRHREDMKRGFFIDGEKYVKLNEKKPQIGLIGHPYMLYDSFMNQDIVKKIEKTGHSVIMQDNVYEPADTTLKFHWNFANRMQRAYDSYLRSRNIKGIIYLTPFGCSSDALIRQNFVISSKTIRKPFMILSFDEHSGQAGQDTRLEAFMDML